MSAYGRLADDRRALAERIRAWRIPAFRTADEARLHAEGLFDLVRRLDAIEHEMKQMGEAS